MRILIITTFYPPAKGGIQTYSYQIAQNLVELGNDITVFALSCDGIKKIFLSPSFRTYKNGKKVSFLNVLTRHDAILVTSWFPSAIIGVFLSRLYSAELFISAHGNELLYPKRNPVLHKLMLFCFKNAKKIFAVSSYTKQLLINEGIEENKIAVIPNGTDPQRFNLNIDFKELVKKHDLQNKKIILSISRLVKRKNFGAVIEVMPEILKEVPDAVYIIGGTGPMEEEWKKLAEEKEVEDKVIFVGYIPDEDLPKYYAMCDVFVMPSIEMKEEGEVEGFGIAFLEANACGKPVIGGKSGGVEDAIVDGETGFLVDPINKKEIKEKIIKILKNPSLAKSLGMKGRKRIEEELSWRKVTERLMKELTKDEG